MKRILLVLATLVFSSLTLFAQKPEDVAILKKVVVALNERVQQESKELFVTYNESTKTVDFCPSLVGDEEFDALKMALKAEPSVMDGAIRKMFYEDGKPNELLTMLSKAQAKFNFLLKNKKTGETIGRKLNVGQIVSIPEVKDVKEDVENRLKKNAADFLPLLVQGINEDLPEEWDDGLTLVRVAVEKTAFVFYFKCDEKETTMSEIKKEGKEMQEDMKEEFAAMAKDKEDRTFAEMLVNSKLDIVFHIEGAVSNETVEFILKNEELRQLLK